MPGRRPVVGVMGSGSTPEAELAQPLAQLLAERGVSLLTGVRTVHGPRARIARIRRNCFSFFILDA